MDTHERPVVKHGDEPIGHLEGPLPSGTDGLAVVRLDDGAVLRVPASALRPTADGAFEAVGDLTRLRAPGDELVVGLAAERLRIRRQPRATGRVVVRVRPVEHRETVELPLARERVEVEHVACDRYVDRPEAVRQEGDVTIVPVMEEVLVVEKRLRVREEIHLRRVRETRRVRRTFLLRREHAEVQRADRP